MTLQEAIEKTKNYKGMKVSVKGMMLNPNSPSRAEFLDHYPEARQAWLDGDLKTIADFFGIYV